MHGQLFFLLLYFMQIKTKNNKLNFLYNNIIKCNKCTRLVNFRKKISKEKRKQYMNEVYWGKPITGFGDINGKILSFKFCS